MWRRCLHLRKLIISRFCKWLQWVSQGRSSMDYSSLVKLDLVACRGRCTRMIHDAKDNQRKEVAHICREGSSLVLSLSRARSVSPTYLHVMYGWARSIEHTQLIIIICVFGSRSALDVQRQGEEGSLIYMSSMFTSLLHGQWINYWSAHFDYFLHVTFRSEQKSQSHENFRVLVLPLLLAFPRRSFRCPTTPSKMDF